MEPSAALGARTEQQQESEMPTPVSLPSLYSEYIHATRYARWSDELGRRELWHESIERYITFVVECAKSCGYEMSDQEIDTIRQAALHCEAMMSMRALMTAGPAAARDCIAIYNCTYLTVDDPRAFDEAMYLLMCGTGVGFSVERQLVKCLPEVPDLLFEIDDVIVVDDSRKSWASSYRRLLALLWAGHIPHWDVSRLRPAGTRLKTFGGRASGPAPLIDLFRYTIDIFRGARGRGLTSLECHGLMCKIGDIVVAGGVRRSALISLSNPSDERMRDAKSGDWRQTNPHFELANNSAVWTDKPDMGRFMKEWIALYESKSGERGIVNRQALIDQCERIGRATKYADGTPIEFGVNPCGEICLRPQQCCNLTEIVARAQDTLDDLMLKAEAATIMGTIQSTCTDFTYVRPIWRENCEEERLLGVSITGQMDHPVLNGSRGAEQAQEWMETIRSRTREVNAEWAGKLGINVSAAITTQKPSGTVSQLVDAASGGHARYARHYIRRTRDSKLDPVAEVVRLAGVPCEQDAYKTENWIFSWPIKAPDGAVVTDDFAALAQLERWLLTKRAYTDHNPSCTIHVQEGEWMTVGAWVFDHFDEVGGLSFLPADTAAHGYTQLPFEEIDEDEYKRRVAAMPESIDWAMLGMIEHEDNTEGSRELSCFAGACEITDRPV